MNHKNAIALAGAETIGGDECGLTEAQFLRGGRIDHERTDDEELGSRHLRVLLGGNDAGGGVHWAPQVIKDAADHGLILGENGVLYDRKKGDTLPHNVHPMQVMSEEELAKRAEPTTADVLPNHVARYWDMMALSDAQPVKVIGGNGLLKDKPGFEVDFLSRNSISDEMHSHEKPTVLMPMRGHWRLRFQDSKTVLNPGDTCLINPGEVHAISTSMTGEASLYRVRTTNDPAGLTKTSN